MTRYIPVVLVVLSLAASSLVAMADNGGSRGFREPVKPPAARGRAPGDVFARDLAGDTVRRPLDLSVPPEAHAPLDGYGQGAPTLYRGLPGLQGVLDRNDPIRNLRRALPGLLDPQNDDNPVRIKGRLLREPTEDPSPGSVDGGQIIIEVQTE